jgi:hypothetical protein
MIQFDCPSCSQSLEVEDRGAGLSIGCPKCAAQITIPGEGPLRIRLPSRSTSSLPGSGPSRVPFQTSALKAGWMCLVLFAIAGFFATLIATSNLLYVPWAIYLTLPFLSAATICAIVAMCTHQVKEGLTLLVAAFLVMVISSWLYMSATHRLAENQQKQMRQQLDEMQKALGAPAPHP